MRKVRIVVGKKGELLAEGMKPGTVITCFCTRVTEPDLEKVREVRSLSGAGFNDSAIALGMSGGDVEKAVLWLQNYGLS
jgi:hypothetical protein